MWSGWSSWSGAFHAGPQRSRAVHLGEITLRHGALLVEWYLDPGLDPGKVDRVSLGTTTGEMEPLPVAVEHGGLARGGGGGSFRFPLPSADPPWRLRGDGPAGPWDEEIDPDREVLRDYRAATPARSDAEAGGLRISLDRVCARPERLSVFLAIDPGAVAAHVPSATLSAAGNEFAQIPLPAAAAGALPRRRPLRNHVACFPPQPAGQPAELVIGMVMLDRTQDVTLRVPVPAGGPAVVEPDLEVGTGHRLVEAAFGRHGITLRFAAADDLGLLSFARATDEGGRPLRSEGGSGGGGRCVMLLGPMPDGSRELVLAQARLHGHARGPWRLPFTVPEPGGGIP